MAYQTSMVKDLSIALEAISRVNTEGSAELYNDIAYLLLQAINKTRQEFKRPDENKTTSSDDIPF